MAILSSIAAGTDDTSARIRLFVLYLALALWFILSPDSACRFWSRGRYRDEDPPPSTKIWYRLFGVLFLVLGIYYAFIR